MKQKLVFVILLALLLSMPAVAQINLGGRVGINLATISETDDLGGDFSFRPGLNMGGIVEYMLMDPLGLQVEFVLDQFGAVYKEKGSFDWGDMDENVKIRGNYFSVPMLVRYNLALDDQMTLYGLFGPNVAFLLFGKAKGEEKVSGHKIDEKLSETCKRLDLGVVVGAGVQMPFDQYIVFVDLRYLYGLTNDFKEGGYLGSWMDYVFKNRVLSLNFGVSGLFQLDILQ